jgi:hypothetical protein
VGFCVDVGALVHIATHPRMLYTFLVEYPFPPVGIVGAADGKNRRAFLFLNGLVRVLIELLLCATSVSLCASVVKESFEKTTTETRRNTEVAQRNQTFRAKLL